MRSRVRKWQETQPGTPQHNFRVGKPHYAGIRVGTPKNCGASSPRGERSEPGWEGRRGRAERARHGQDWGRVRRIEGEGLDAEQGTDMARNSSRKPAAQLPSYYKMVASRMENHTMRASVLEPLRILERARHKASGASEAVGGERSELATSRTGGGFAGFVDAVPKSLPRGPCNDSEPAADATFLHQSWAAQLPSSFYYY